MSLSLLRRSTLGLLAVAVVVAALPIAMWLDLRQHSDFMLQRQAAQLTQVISTVRSYYATHVAGRIASASGGGITLRHDYVTHEGAVPIPATLSIELGTQISAIAGDITYRFVSDLPFTDRAPHLLDPLETRALAQFRETRDASDLLFEGSGKAFDREIAWVTPVVMNRACVQCHNTHPQSPKRDWQVGDVRGLQVVRVSQSISPGLSSFRWTIAYFGFAALAVALFAVQQIRQNAAFGRLNAALAEKNDTLVDVSNNVARYIPQQVFNRIFRGEQGSGIQAERKKLTVFLSDIVNFTTTTERMQPEEITGLLNEYFNEMVAIADTHGATIDKFIGDGVLAFFGDPESQGEAEDAKACLRMALAMQKRMTVLQEGWRSRGIETPFQVRMGINTGYCNVGNFGSDERVDYTIIGAEVNLAARLEQLSDPGGIVISYKTYALVDDFIEAEAMAPVAVKGILWPVVPYKVNVAAGAIDPNATMLVAAPGLEVRLEPSQMDQAGRLRAEAILRDTLRKLQSGINTGPKKGRAPDEDA